MTKHECAVVMAYTGVCMLTGDDQKHFYEYVAELIGRPVYTHELPGLAETIEEKAKPDFLELCRTATEPTGQGRHGRWIPLDSKTAKCSRCGWWQHAKTYNLPNDIKEFSGCYRYCTACGAQMVGGEDDDKR